MKLTEKQLLILETVGSLQLFIQSNCNDKLDNEISFELDGAYIAHPLQDETSEKNVDPVKYYGEAFLNSKFMDLI